jgi:hypothetical protein
MPYKLWNSDGQVRRLQHLQAEIGLADLAVQLDQLHPVVLPHVSHFMQVPLRTRVKLPHSPQASPS